METVFYILAKSVSVAIDVISLSMMVRAFLPLFADVEESSLYMLSVAITEPFVAPIRFVMERLGIGLNTPIDMGFLASYIILCILDLLLPAI